MLLNLVPQLNDTTVSLAFCVTRNLPYIVRPFDGLLWVSPLIHLEPEIFRSIGRVGALRSLQKRLLQASFLYSDNGNTRVIVMLENSSCRVCAQPLSYGPSPICLNPLGSMNHQLALSLQDRYLLLDGCERIRLILFQAKKYSANSTGFHCNTVLIFC